MTKRNTPFLLLVSLFLALVAGCVESEDAFWDDSDDDLGESTSELVTPPGMVAFSLYESTDHIVNPERGYYKGYKLEAAGDASSLRSAGYTLAISIVDLDAYTYGAIPSSFLTQLSNGFARARTAGIKLIVRFTYDDTGGSDASISRILGHISQLGPVMRDNADVIAAVQGGFVGAWGEWHSSSNGIDTATERNQIIAALLANFPSNRSVQLRKPTFKNAYRAGALTSAEAYTGSSRSRLGHHNDCFLASSSDLGTYDSPVESWKSYTATDTQYAPNGGETCKVYTARTNCTTALAELESRHFSYLNRAYQEAVINDWIADGCESTIRRRLGYRFFLSRVAHTPRVAPGGILGLEVDIKNRGYAVPMNQRPVDVVLTRGSVRHVARLSLDARRMPAGLTTTVRANLRLPANLAAGTYSVSMRMPDASSRLSADPRYAIQFANSGVWNPTTGDNLLTANLVIDASAGGSIDASASKFTVIP